MMPTHVRPPVPHFTDADVREIIREVLLPLCSDMGPTRLAATVGDVDEKTLRRARDEQTTLCLDTVANLLKVDEHALDGFLARAGRRSVPIGAVCDTDALPAMTGAVHKLVVAASPTSPDGVALSRSELFDADRDIREAFDALGGLLSRIDAYRHGKAA